MALEDFYEANRYKPKFHSTRILCAPNSIGSPNHELLTVSNRKLVLRLTGKHEMKFDVLEDEALYIEDHVTDIWWDRDGEYLARTRVTAATDNADANGYKLSVPSIDYREILRGHRFTQSVQSYTTTDQASIAWGLINHTQTQTNGSLGITNATSATGVTRTYSVAMGTSIGESIDTLGAMDSGFDWEITPTMQFKIYHPTRGKALVDADFTLSYPGNLQEFVRAGSETFANNGIQFGADGTTPVIANASDLAIAAEGRWEIVGTASQVTTPLTDLAKSLVASQDPSYTLIQKPNLWNGTDEVGLGDYIRISARAGRIFEDLTARVLEISIELDQNNVENVTFTLSQPVSTFRDIYLAQKRLLRNADKR